MSLWFDLKGKSYSGTHPATWMKRYMESLVSKLFTVLDDEAAARQAEDTALSAKLASEVASRQTEDTAISANLANEIATRQAEDVSLSARLAEETANREDADATISASLATEIASRQAEDVSLSARLAEETANREDADAAISASLANEIASRQAEDAVLSQRLDAIPIKNSQGEYSAAGQDATATAAYSFAHGQGTIANQPNQVVLGKYNLEDPDGEYALIVGCGKSKTRDNCLTLDWSGNAEFSGSVLADGKVLATREEMTYQLGLVSQALDSILAMQEAMLGGSAV